jgi:CheY-like chemotaxis protein
MILVVEDHEETRWVLLRLLERRGHEAVGVGDGPAVLQFLRERIAPPRVIVLDHGLPRMDGLAVLRALSADERCQGTRVIFYTASPLPSVADAALRAGAAEVVIKCGDWGPLLSAVERWAGAPDQPSGARAPAGSSPSMPEPTYATPS